jgi:opacity protein-like surface antigen
MEIAATYAAIPEFFGPTCHGAAGSLSYNVNRWFGVTGEISGCKGRGPSGIGFFGPPPERTNTWFSYLVGPRVSYRRRFTPYAHVLFGGAHRNTDASIDVFQGNAFALTVGVGVDVRISKHIGIRIIQPEYLRSDFGNVREDLRLQTGIVFALGK